jgi:hypothetical protein
MQFVHLQKKYLLFNELFSPLTFFAEAEKK